jgi:hypothetical protein
MFWGLYLAFFGIQETVVFLVQTLGKDVAARTATGWGCNPTVAMN